jgi:hypothetical protein
MMTFIINQQGGGLAEGFTQSHRQIAKVMEEYDPDKASKPSPD